MRRLALLLALLCATSFAQQTNHSIKLIRCDRLLLVPVESLGKKFNFLLDTGATTMLDIGSFKELAKKALPDPVNISSWKGEASEAGRRVIVPLLQIQSYEVRNLKLPAIDLSRLGEACGNRIDGLLGIDLLEKMKASLDLDGEKAYLRPRLAPPQTDLEEARQQFYHCHESFNEGNVDAMTECFDENATYFTPWEVIHGRKNVIDFLKHEYMDKGAKMNSHFEPLEFHFSGDTYWINYEYEVHMPGRSYGGRGTTFARRQDGRWVTTNILHSFVAKLPAEQAK
jgi:hypothetical protein